MSEKRSTLVGIASVTAVAVAAAVFGWYVGSRISDERVSMMQTELKAYRDVQAAQLPQLSSELRILSQDLGVQLKEGKAIKALSEVKREQERLTEEIGALKTQLATTRATCRALEERLVVQDKEIVVPVGGTGELVKGELFVGVEHNFGSWATVNIGDRRSINMSVGHQLVIPVHGEDYQLVMTDIQDKECKFRFSKVTK